MLKLCISFFSVVNLWTARTIVAVGKSQLKITRRYCPLFQNKLCDLGKEKDDFLTKQWENIRSIRDVREYLKIDDIFVPVIGRGNYQGLQSFIQTRQLLITSGIYPGVEYKILNTSISFNSSINANQELWWIRPMYPLIEELEREWPVLITATIIPKVLSRGMYNTLAVAGAAALSATILSFAILLSQCITFR